MAHKQDEKMRAQQGRNEWFVFKGALFVVFFFSVLFMGFCRGILTDQDVAIRTLEAQGYSDIEIIDKAWWAVGFRGCDESDATRFTAQATNPTGNRVEVYVCTGAFVKGGTIRVR